MVGTSNHQHMTCVQKAARCDCPECHQPMKLINSVPKLGALPELLVFYCRACDEVEGVDGATNSVPTMWRSVQND